MSEKLTPKQKMFISEYLIDFNGTRSAKAAGYAEKYAAEEASKLIRNPKVAKKIKKAMAKRQEIAYGKSIEVMKQLSKIAFAKIGDVAQWDSEELNLINSNLIETDFVQEVQQLKGKVKVKLHDKVKALELLGKHLGMFNEEEQNERSNREIIEDEILEDLRIIQEQTEE